MHCRHLDMVISLSAFYITSSSGLLNPAEPPINLCVQNSTASLSHSSKPFHIAPENKLQRSVTQGQVYPSQLHLSQHQLSVLVIDDG